MATINLGAIKFNWRGSYSGATAYVVDDVVESGGNSYVCILASTGNTPPNATYWELMAQAGTNGTDGTDLTTTLTTQGDIVYRDGSGLQRLGAGTSGQVLQTGGTGANPSWGTVSSDYVKLAETNVTSAVARVDFINAFSSTYDTYKIIASNVSSDTSNPNICFRYMNNTSYFSSTNYQSNHLNVYADGSSANHNTNREWSVDKHHLTNWGLSSIDDHSSSFELTIYNPLSSTQETTAYASYTVNYNSYSNLIGGISGHAISTNNSFDGISIFPATNNFDTGIYKIYGIK